jgi:hypothetical protein
MTKVHPLIQVEETDQEVVITRRWGGAAYVVIEVVVTLGLLGWLAPPLVSILLGPDEHPLHRFVVAPVILLMCFGVCYRAVAVVFNRTRFVITARGISVTHGPVSWPEPPFVELSEVVRLEWTPVGKKLELVATLASGEKVWLLRLGYQKMDQADAIERQLGRAAARFGKELPPA